MHFSKLLPAALLGVICLSSGPNLLAQEKEGSKPYIPTRGEWIAVLFNSTYQIDEMATHGFRIKYVCPPGHETVVIHVTHRADVGPGPDEQGAVAFSQS